MADEITAVCVPVGTTRAGTFSAVYFSELIHKYMYVIIHHTVHVLQKPEREKQIETAKYIGPLPSLPQNFSGREREKDV